MIKCLVFDLDGTLLDTLEDITISINYAFNKYNYKVNYTKNDVKKFIGHGALDLIKLAGISVCLKEEDTLKVYQAYKNQYNSSSTNKTKPFDGVIETLKELKNKYTLCVLSNKKDEDTKRCINHYFKDIFDYVSGEVEGVSLKPDVEGIDLILNKFNFKLDEIIYIGDMQVDEQLCINSKIKFIGCNYGYSLIPFKKYYGLISSFKEILNLL